ALRKKPRLPPGDKYRSNDPPIADHRHTEAATPPAHARSVFALIRSIGKDVWNMADGSRSYRTRCDRLGIAPQRIQSPDRINAFLSYTVDGNQANLVTIDHRNHADLCIAQFLRTLANGLEHRFQVVERA